MLSRLVRWALWLVAVVGVLTCALGGYASVADPSLSSWRHGHGGVVQAHTLPGDQLKAGPVLVDHRAVWVEAGRRLLVRSLDGQGRTRTIFSTSAASAAPGAPKGTPWPFSVQSIAAGDGRVAFVEEVVPCGSAPPSARRSGRGPCAPSPTGYGPPADSLTVFEGRPGAVRRVETDVFRHRCGRPLPGALGVADSGLVVSERPCPRHGPPRARRARLVLRTFSGRLVRILAPPLPNTTSFVAAGDWVALIKQPQAYGQPFQLQIIRVSTGQTVLTQTYPGPPSTQGLDAVALDPSGRYAVMTDSGEPPPCKHHNGFDVLSEGQIGHAGTQVLTSKALATVASLGGIGSLEDFAIAGDRVAYAQPTDRCAHPHTGRDRRTRSGPHPRPGPRGSGSRCWPSTGGWSPRPTETRFSSQRRADKD